MSGENLTFGEHLDELRKMLVRVSCVVALLMLIAFFFKENVFGFLLAPCSHDFVTYTVLRNFLASIGVNTSLFTEDIELITTDISSQFMAHLSVSFYSGLLLSSPYILYELMKYISPALYDNEKKYANRILIAVYMLFFLGMVVSYLILFPVSSRFLSGYNVSPDVQSLITLDSYLSLFISLTLMMGVVFELPVLAVLLAKIGIVDDGLMAKYRRHAFVLILVLAAIITPPDILTLVIVSLPLYLLYEVSIIGVRIICGKKQHKE